jgi:hypothetical protein
METKISELLELCKIGEKMTSLTARINSFTDWPFTNTLSPRNMAENGWYQSGELSARNFVTLKELAGWEGNVLR